MILNNVSIALSGRQVSIRVNNGKIAQISPGALYDSNEKCILHFENALIFPGLINSHDHLDFNLFPPLGGKIYRSYTQWGQDIHQKHNDQIRQVLQVPETLRLQWGIYKNLLCGVTTVVNHGKRIAAGNDLLTVFQDCQSIHSVKFEKRWRFALNNPLKKNLSAVIHCGEGIDLAAYWEISQLTGWNLVKRPLIAVHGLAMSEEQAGKFRALVWCPDSNYFLFGQTAPVNRLKHHLPVLFGTDSALTSNWNIWNHIRRAKQTGLLSDQELYDSLTINPARIWKLNSGELNEGKDADLVITRLKDVREAGKAFFLSDPGEILAVIHKGAIVLFDQELLSEIKAINTSDYSKITLGGSTKYVKGDLPALICKIKQYYPNAVFPVN